LCLVNFHRELDFDGANQSLRIIKNLIEAGSYHSCAAIDDIISMFLEFTNLIIRMKLSAAYSLAVKVFISDIQHFIFTWSIWFGHVKQKFNWKQTLNSFPIVYKVHAMQIIVLNRYK
jgi:hypothetical protein